MAARRTCRISRPASTPGSRFRAPTVQPPRSMRARHGRALAREDVLQVIDELEAADSLGLQLARLGRDEALHRGDVTRVGGGLARSSGANDLRTEGSPGALERGNGGRHLLGLPRHRTKL